jgi:hypothetical protein
MPVVAFMLEQETHVFFKVPLVQEPRGLDLPPSITAGFAMILGELRFYK